LATRSRRVVPDRQISIQAFETSTPTRLSPPLLCIAPPGKLKKLGRRAGLHTGVKAQTTVRASDRDAGGSEMATVFQDHSTIGEPAGVPILTRTGLSTMQSTPRRLKTSPISFRGRQGFRNEAVPSVAFCRRLFQPAKYVDGWDEPGHGASEPPPTVPFRAASARDCPDPSAIIRKGGRPSGCS
jgi:hypothetical protein